MHYTTELIVGGLLVPEPAEISNEMSKLPNSEDYYDAEMKMESSYCPDGCIEEGVSLTRAMRSPRRAYNNMW